MSILTSTGSFTVIAALTPLVDTVSAYILPPVSAPFGKGRIVHPFFGAFDYEVKPDEWVNIDGDAIIAPIWSSTRTLTSGINVLWQGNIRDVMVEERWKQALSMPIGQFRELLAIWMNPVDPVIGYVQWWPNYTTEVGYNVIPIDLSVGGSEIALTDLVNYLDAEGHVDGWLEGPVTFKMKLVGKVG